MSTYEAILVQLNKDGDHTKILAKDTVLAGCEQSARSAMVIANLDALKGITDFRVLIRPF